jgi:hypothetical protein
MKGLKSKKEQKNEGNGNQPQDPSPPATKADVVPMTEQQFKEAVIREEAILTQKFGFKATINGENKLVLDVDKVLEVMNTVHGRFRCMNCKRYARTYQYHTCVGTWCKVGFCSNECALQGYEVHASEGHPQWMKGVAVKKGGEKK